MSPRAKATRRPRGARAKRRTSTTRRKPVRRAGEKPKRARIAAPKRTRARTAAAPKRRARATARPSRRRTTPQRAPRALKTARRVPKRPRQKLKLVPRRTPPPPAFPQAQDGSAKQRLLFELLRARTTLMAAIHGLSGGSSEQPLAAGKWTVREVVLHLIARDRVRLRDMEAALLGRRPVWFDDDTATAARANETDLAPLRQHGWDEALRLLQTTRQQLMDAIEALPDEPSAVWTAAHPFGELIGRLPPHDRHHAEAIKRWRTERGE